MKQYMLLLTALFVILSVFGCTEKTLNVSITNAIMNTSTVEDGKKLDLLQFTLTNNEKFDIDCQMIARISNTTNTTTNSTNVGNMGVGERKDITLKIEMLEGEADMKITSDCRRVQ